MRAADLVQGLSEAGLRPKHYQPSRDQRLICPKCQGGSHREKSLNLRIDDDGAGAVWNCHRATCGHTDFLRIGPSFRRARSVPPKRKAKPTPPPEHRPDQQDRPETMYAWFAKRGISPDTVDTFGCYVTTHWFHDGGDQRAIVFPYLFGGKVVNRKYRAPNKAMAQEKNPLPTLFNADSIKTPDEVCWVEGETDCLALYEAGYRQIVSLKDGSDDHYKDEDDPTRDDDKRFFALQTHADLLEKVQKFYLAGDMDGPGLLLREELARRLGRHRCWLVTWPDGCKDACDTLAQHGPDVVCACILEATPYPIEGINHVSGDVLLSHLRQPPPGTMSTGTTSLDGVLKLPREGRLIVVTGMPNAGKALALDTPVPTPDGWTTMGAIKAGDVVYAADGTPTKVTSAWDVMYGRPCWKIVFSDGTEIVADEDHQWFTRCEKARFSADQTRKKRGDREETLPRGTDQRHMKTYPSVKTTREIVDSLISFSSGNLRPNHSVPVAAPIWGGPWSLETPPYTLGAWLGDGNSSDGGITSADEEIIDSIRSDGFDVRKSRSGRYRWHILNVVGALRSDGVLGNKHIPQAALRADEESRRSLLQGLMDTDGHASSRGEAEFCTVNQILAACVFDLVASLGLKPKLRKGRALLNGRDCGDKYRVFFQPEPQSFRLSRKREAVNTSQVACERRRWRRIVSAERVESVPVRCIAVEHPSRLFLVSKAMIPTHNSQFTMFLIVHLILRENRRFLVFSPEMMPAQEYVLQCAEILSGKPARRGSNWTDSAVMTDEDVLSAGDFLREKLIVLASDAEESAPTLDWILERSRDCVFRYGVTDLLVDAWNEIEHQRGGMTETDYTGRALQQLRGFSNRRGCNVWLVAHPAKLRPAKPGEKIPVPGPYEISGSAHFANKSDLGLTVHTPDNETEIHLWKSRFRRWGRKGGVARLEFNPVNGRYGSPLSLQQEHGYDPWPLHV